MKELAFFEDYCSHFNKQDAVAVGDCFSGPLTFFLPDGNNHSFNSREEMDENTSKLFEIYNSLGFHWADFNLLSVISLAEHQHLCQIKWNLFNNKRELFLTFETSYLLSGDEQHYSITAVFVKNEPEKLKALQGKNAEAV